MSNEHDPGDSYQQLLDLEELESLHEEIEEAGVDPRIQWGDLPEELRERLAAFGVDSLNELVTRIAYMHAQLDEQ